jgi:hypothetical protein
MLRLELTAEEAAILDEVLKEYVSDLRMEIVRTDSMDFREGLKEKQRVLKDLIRKLEGMAIGAAV